jgi:HEAT repeat protein
MKRWFILAIVCIVAGAAGLIFLLRPARESDGQAEALRDKKPAVRAAAIRKLPYRSDEPLLIDALKDENQDVRLLAIRQLGFEGPKGAERAKLLIPLLKDDHAGVRREAAWSLGHIGKDAEPLLRDALSDDDARVRAGAAQALEDARTQRSMG